MSRQGDAQCSNAHGLHSCAISELTDALLYCTVITAKERAILFKAVPKDSDAARGTSRSEGMDRTLKAIIAVSLPIHRHLETLVVIIAASFAFGHRMAPLLWSGEFLQPRLGKPGVTIRRVPLYRSGHRPWRDHGEQRRAPPLA
jgi:hypothetical protein